MLNGKIDLRSDTITQPTGEMREAMAKAEVGDDVFGDDPTVNKLQREAARMMGKEDALFVPSGTMGNLLAVMTQTKPGDSVILSDLAHPVHFEAGNIAHIAGVQVRPVHAENGILTADHVRANAVLMDDDHLSHTSLVMVENTVNLGGGTVYPLETFAEIGAASRELGLRVHCDGARIFNACVSAGVDPSAYAQHVDTVSFCLSKGLGCPVGSLLAGDGNTVHQARRYRKALGGGMRQVGVIAAAGLYALENQIDRLADDHRRAARFRDALASVEGIGFSLPCPTNLVYLDVADAFWFVAELANKGVLALAESPTHVRAAFNLHVTDEDTERAIEAFARIAESVPAAMD